MNQDDPPSARAPHLVADWLEMACALNANGVVAATTLADGREEVDNRGGGENSAAKQDARNREAEEVWELLRHRAAHYGSDYPFEVDTDSLELRTLGLTDGRMTYVFLLAAASLSWFEAKERHHLTHAFERASRHVLESLLPANSVVSVFGTAARPGERYGHTKLIDRLRALAGDLATSLTQDAEAETQTAGPRNSGDGGLDLVGWPELHGPPKRIPVYFGQCACGKEWTVKPYEVAQETWDTRLQPVSSIISVTLIPYAYRSLENDWLDLFPVPRTVLIDRPRWMALFSADPSRQASGLSELPNAWLVRNLPGLLAGVATSATVS